MQNKTRLCSVFLACLLAAGCSDDTGGAGAMGGTGGTGGMPGPTGLKKLGHIVVIYLENHSFDNLYGLFPGANGLGRPGAAIRQVDRHGVPYARLPQPVASYPWPPTPDRRFPKELPNAPFLIDRYVPLGQIVPMPVHRFYQHQLQNDGGRMDKYIAWSDSGALTMGYFDTTKLPLYPYARQYTLADNYFTAAFGGSTVSASFLAGEAAGCAARRWALASATAAAKACSSA